MRLASVIIILVAVAWALVRRLWNKFGPEHGPRRVVIKNRRLEALRGLTSASIKMYFRNRTALFFTLFFPIFFILIFGSIFKNTSTSFDINITNNSHSQLASQFEKAIKKIPAFKVKDVSESTGRDNLDKNKADLQIVIPANFGQPSAGAGGHSAVLPSQVAARYNGARPQNGQAAAQIVAQVATSLNDAISGVPKVISVNSIGVKTKNLNYIDFLLPGMAALSIMQLGIFSVAFAFVSYKSTGMLRRLQATPTPPSDFLAAQGITRMIVGVLQTTILVALGVALFGFHLQPSSWLPFLILSVLGSAVFMGFGFAVAGWAQNEDQAAPVANLITFPMMFLSGVFFSREGFPPLLQTITNYFPLTYLADAMRQVANDGVGLWAVRGDLLGLAIWGVVSAAVAIRLFRWE
jgi:ABC-2 type transport system permease protein